jgi:hypothetical protein
MPDRSNADEGADPSQDLKRQNPGGTTTEDLTEGEDTKTQDLTKAGRDDMDPNAGEE